MEFLNAWRSQTQEQPKSSCDRNWLEKARTHSFIHIQQNENKNKLVLGTCSRCIQLALYVYGSVDRVESS